MSERDRRGAAFHEAGHVVVAWALGLSVRNIEIGTEGDDAAGHAQIGCSVHLPIVDRIASCAAGIEAQRIFDAPTNEWAGMSDFVEIGNILDDDIFTEKEGERLRAKGFERAHGLLIVHREMVEQVANSLVKE